MPQNLAVINKKEGETPLEALEHFRKKQKISLDVPITYAGRLDPMAKGLLILLLGQKTKEKEKYLKLEKEYQFEVLFGFSTDTYDVLGKVTKIQEINLTTKDLKEKIEKILGSFLGKSIQKYPIYSSRTVKGKPLFSYARKGEKVEIPTKEIFIKKINLKKIQKISKTALRKNVCTRIHKVSGDFRQAEILDVWRKSINQNKSKYYLKASFFVQISSGGYVRSLAKELGDKINIPSLAFSIKRTKIGKWCNVDHVV
ncbi:MAG: hypothetical protein K9L98_02960 [Candidatus Pacebacteria bacterium]|nr:hypothetical protein [Candidatus Paceibacterota bacterium]MCF7862942.1 hypothetical protein [Candidatus Paceibacterota bacterium]